MGFWLTRFDSTLGTRALWPLNRINPNTTSGSLNRYRLPCLQNVVGVVQIHEFWRVAG